MPGRYMKPFGAIRAWLSAADYFAATERATDELVARVARNNVLFQQGLTMDEAEQAHLSTEGDKAVERLARRFGRGQTQSRQ